MAREYKNVDEWIADVRLTFSNAMVFNPPDHLVHQMAKSLKNAFDKKLASVLEKLDTRSFVNDGSVNLGQGAGLGEWPRKAKAILKMVMDHPQAFPFNEAVDWKKLKIPDYPKIIKKPMDLGKIDRQLNMNQYNSVDDFATDVRLTFTNARSYNVEFSDIHQMAKVVEAYFEDKFGQVFKGKKRPPGSMGGGANQRPKTEDEDLEDVTHQLPDEPTEAEKARPITVDEKRLLNDKISVLKSDDLGKMVDIIKDRCPKSIDQTKDDEIEIDVDALEPGDFWYVSKFVSMCAAPAQA